MLSSVHQFLFYLHVACGSVGLVVFWLPMLSKKGNGFHKQYGKIFAYGMFAVSISGILMSMMLLIDPIGVRVPDRNLPMGEAFSLAGQNRELGTFLLMLSLLVFTNIKHSLLVLSAKDDRSVLRKTSHMLSIAVLFVAGLIVGYFAITDGNILFMVFAILSVVSSIGLTRYIFKPTLKKREWLIEHLGNIIGSGIGAYTAFFAFGGRRFFEDIFTGQMELIPWILPGIIGGIASYYLSKKYQLKYRVV
jgi:uncharacterized membrane protein